MAPGLPVSALGDSGAGVGVVQMLCSGELGSISHPDSEGTPKSSHGSHWRL